MNNNKKQRFAINDLLVDPSHNEITRDTVTIRLQPKVMDVLTYLARHYDRVISNDELIEHVWCGRVVTHSSVQKSINFLRKALAELGVDSQLIAHFSKQGYQLQCQPTYQEEIPSDQGNHGLYRKLIRLWYQRRILSLTLFIAIIGLTTVLFVLSNTSEIIDKSHRLSFDDISGYTSQMGHERGSSPHPNNEHVAYIRRASSHAADVEELSRLTVRGNNGEDWSFASSDGSWSMLEWSPSGQFLAAIEHIPKNRPYNTPDFFTQTENHYNIHILALDLDNKHLREQHRLSQWLGKIESITWWDDATIEIVGKQGSSAVNYRYRYSIQTQRLDVLAALPFAPNPSASRTHNKMTAIASSLNNQTRIDFLDEHQRLINHWSVDSNNIEFSWIPDGSGLLIQTLDNNELFALYRDGTRADITLNTSSGLTMSTPRFSADGNTIFYTQQSPQGNIWLESLSGEHSRLTENRFHNYSGRQITGNTELSYVSIRNNEHQIWLIDVQTTSERQLTHSSIPEAIDDFMWIDNNNAFLYASESQVILQSANEHESTVLASNIIDPIILSYSAETDELLISRTKAEARNLWSINAKTGSEKQLTLGAIGSALIFEETIYFQYTNQSGLWEMEGANGKPIIVTKSFPQNSHLLSIESGIAYYITGGQCRESDIYAFDIERNQHSLHLARRSQSINTHAYHPKTGAIYTKCLVAESDIVQLK